MTGLKINFHKSSTVNLSRTRRLVGESHQFLIASLGHSPSLTSVSSLRWLLYLDWSGNLSLTRKIGLPIEKETPFQEVDDLVLLVQFCPHFALYYMSFSTSWYGSLVLLNTFGVLSCEKVIKRFMVGFVLLIGNKYALIKTNGGWGYTIFEPSTSLFLQSCGGGSFMITLHHGPYLCSITTIGEESHMTYNKLFMAIFIHFGGVSLKLLTPLL